MKRVVVIGGSVAAVAAIERLRDNGVSVEPVFLFLDDQIPAMRHYFPRYLAHEIKPADVLYRKKDYYERLTDQVFFNKKIERINFKKGRVITSEKEQIDYDLLLLGDLNGPQFPDIKGKNKTGVFCGDRFADIVKLREDGVASDVVAVQTRAMNGLMIARSLVKQRREVLVFIPGGWDVDLDAAETEWLSKIFAAAGIRLFYGEHIQEILGEAEIKAIRISNGKVIECQSVIFTDLPPDLRLLNGSEVQTDNGIVVNEALRTSVENVYALDTLVRPGTSEREAVSDLGLLELQGNMAAEDICGGMVQGKEASVPLKQFTDDEITVDMAGLTIGAGLRVIKNFDPAEGVFHIAYLKDDVIVGALLINDRKNMDKYLRLIKEKDNLKEHDDLINIIIA